MLVLMLFACDATPQWHGPFDYTPAASCQFGLDDTALAAAVETAMSTSFNGDPDRTPAAHGMVFG
jgi:hypothetical protein